MSGGGAGSGTAGDGLEFPWVAPPGVGERTSVRDGLDWVRQPLPFRLDHVNCWWLDAGEGGGPTGSDDGGSDDDGGRGRALIDTCISGEASIRNWRAALGDAVPDTLLVTHFHPDHAGLAGHFHGLGARLLGCELEMTLSSRIRGADPAAYARVYAEWYRANGLPEDVVAAVLGRGNAYRAIVDARPPLEAWTWLDAGDELRLGGRTWTVRVGRGHAPRMLMLHCAEEALLIAADQVLPSISPNVSVFPGDGTLFGARDDDPLGSFLASLDELRALPADTLVLPSHGRPFLGLHARLDALAAHHDERLGRVLAACADGPRTAAELFDVLFGRKLDAQQTAFALGEALAHARRLELRGELARTVDARGIARFSRA